MIKCGYVLIYIIRGAEMARINGSGIGGKGSVRSGESSLKGAKKSSEAEKGSEIDIKHGLFIDRLNEIGANFDRESLNKNVEEIKELGEMLVRNPTLKRLEEYKAMVAKFLSEALKKIYKVENKKGLTRPGREQKVYIVVDKVDTMLEEMVMGFVKEQSKPIALVNTVEEIQGLLYSILA